MTFPGHTIEIIRIYTRSESRQGGRDAEGSRIFYPLNNESAGNKNYYFSQFIKGLSAKTV